MSAISSPANHLPHHPPFPNKPSPTPVNLHHSYDMYRNGKIARLPRHIRDELNKRLYDEVPGCQLVDWLNSLPEVRQVLQQHFEGREINAPNLTDWKQGGYAEWLLRQETIGKIKETAGDAAEIEAAVDGRLTGHMTAVVTAKYAAALVNLDDAASDGAADARMRVLHGLCYDIASIRRGDRFEARDKLEQARYDFEREKTELDVVEFIIRWMEFPAVLDCLRNKKLTAIQRKVRLCDIFGIQHPSRDPDESNELEDDDGN